MGEQLSNDSPTLIVKWSSAEYVIDCLDPDNSVADLKNYIFSKTGVKPERQKLMGLKTKNSKLYPFIVLYELIFICIC